MFTFVRDLVGDAADSIGFAHDRALLIFCLLAGFPLGIIHRLLPPAEWLKHARPQFSTRPKSDPRAQIPDLTLPPLVVERKCCYEQG